MVGAFTVQKRFLEYDRTLGMTTMEGKGFYYPIDTAIDRDGRIYTVSRSPTIAGRGVRVTVLNAESEYFGTFGAFGEGEGQLIWPSGIAVDGGGRVYLSDIHLHNVSCFDRSGSFLYRWGGRGTGRGELDTPSSLAFGGDDSLYVSDTYNNRMQKLTARGEFLLSFGAQGDGPGELSLPWGVTVAPDGDVYVADWGNDRIQRYSGDGELRGSYGEPGRGDGQFHRPSSVAVDGEGYVYVADWGNERVQVLDPEGGFVMKLRGQATHSQWAENFLKVNVEEAVARGRADLEPDLEFPEEDPHEESSHIEKLFWSPASVVLDAAGRVYVTETSRHRIQVYKRGA